MGEHALGTQLRPRVPVKEEALEPEDTELLAMQEQVSVDVIFRSVLILVPQGLLGEEDTFQPALGDPSEEAGRSS